VVFRPKKSITELEQETERLEVEDRKSELEYSIAERKAMIAKLKDRGLTPKHFGDTSQGSTWKNIWNWLKTH